MTDIKPTLVERLIAPFKRLTQRAEDEYQARLWHRNRLAAHFGISEAEAHKFHITVEPGTGNILISGGDFRDPDSASMYAASAGMSLSGHSKNHITLTR